MSTIVELLDLPPLALNRGKVHPVPWLYDHSTLKSLTLCNPRYLCQKSICWRCAPRKARATARMLKQQAPASSAYLRLSVSTTYDFESAMLELEDVTRLFTRSSWLSSRSTSWFRSYEVTRSHGLWNAHVNFVVAGTPEQVEELLPLAVPRWLEAAERIGATASPHAQYAQQTKSYAATATYVSKGIMTPAKSRLDGSTPGDVFQSALSGDPDAAQLWAEIENFTDRYKGFKWTQRGGTLRGFTG